MIEAPAGPLQDFAADVGESGAVCIAGGRTQWDVGGPGAPGTRTIGAPSGVVSHQPAEMIVRVRAGTTLAELRRVVGEGGQAVALEADDPERATVGGLLAVGRGGFRRLGLGPPRDAVLEVTAVTAGGELIRSGAPLVKNVTGFDLCRLLVGSLGTLALLGEVVLRCRPVPEADRWWVGPGADPFDLAARLYRPLAILWDGSSTWVNLAGYRRDVDDQAAAVLRPSFEEVAGPPPSPGPARLSRRPGALRDLPGQLGGDGWLAEVGVGVVHCRVDGPAWLGPAVAPAPEAVRELHRSLKARFDPDGRLNPGRSPLAAA